MKDKILSALRETAEREGVRILYACESGSRAWGFASKDSDYDVRFIYVRPLKDYLKVREVRDVIEAMLPDDIDLAGWDLRKTMGLLGKANPSLFEWLASPVVYDADETFIGEFRQFAKAWYSERRLFRHYIHMAEGNWQRFLQGEEVSHKKYLYVLRPTLACRWIEQGRGEVPMEFSRLLAALPNEATVRDAIERLVTEKASGVEIAVGPPNPILHEFLRGELPRLDALELEEPVLPETSELDSFFQKWVLPIS